jgi:fatty-acid desaturase
MLETFVLVFGVVVMGVQVSIPLIAWRRMHRTHHTRLTRDHVPREVAPVDGAHASPYSARARVGR